MLGTNHRRHAVSVAASILAAGVALPAAVAAQGVPESAYAALRWRFVGPLRAGWATVSAGVPGDPATAYFAGADDAARTWQPLFGVDSRWRDNQTHQA